MPYRSKTKLRQVEASRLSLAVVTSLAVIATVAILPVNICEGAEELPEWKPVNWQTLDPRDVAERWPCDAGARYPSEWVTTPLHPVVIRQNHPGGPTYQEALGHTFLLFDTGFPRMARMPDGTLVLRMTQFIHLDSHPETAVKMFSYDDGRSWSAPVKDTVLQPERGQLVPLGGQELMLYGTTVHFSRDGGRIWGETLAVPVPEGEHPWYNKGSILVEGDTITVIGFHGNASGSSLRRSYDRGRTWQKPVLVPEFKGCSEGSIVRAKDGALVAALRRGDDEAITRARDGLRRAYQGTKVSPLS